MCKKTIQRILVAMLALWGSWSVLQAQCKLDLKEDNAFGSSNLQIVLDGNTEIALLSKECVVINGAPSVMQLVYIAQPDHTIDLTHAYVLGKAEEISFSDEGLASSRPSNQTWQGSLYISKEGKCGYTPITEAKDATLHPYLLVDQRGEEIESYPTVKIGNQVWMRENLRTALFQDGTAIKTDLKKDEWESLKSPAVTYYDGNTSNRATMGALYNWYAVTATTTTLAPKGWQVPSTQDWNALVKYLDPKGFMPDEYDNPSTLSYTAGEMLKSKEGWTHSPTGKPEQILVGNNLSQLDIKPFGSTSTSKFFNGYSGKGLQAYLWSRTQSDYEASKGEFFRVFWDQKTANLYFDDKFMGFSVRCILNAPIQLAEVQPSDPTTLTLNIATAGTLASQFTAEIKQTVSKLTLKGTLDARDFAALRQLSKLNELALEEVKILAYRGDGGPVSGVKKYPEKEIPAESFKGFMTLSSFKATGEIGSLGANCFENCIKLSDVQLPEALSELNGNNFKGCTALTTIVIPNSVTDLGTSTFENCTALQAITLPKEIEELGDSLFKGCKALTIFSIPTTVTNIGMSAFENCSALTQIEIPDAVETIGMFAFQGCTALQTATLGKGITEVDYGTFLGNYALKNVALPENLKTIGAFSFQGCTALKALTIPQSVTKISNGAFRGTTISFILPEGSLFMLQNQMLLSKDGKTIYNIPSTFKGELIIPDGVETINGAAFADCKGLAKAELPTSLKEIKLMAFENTALYELTMKVADPKTIKLGDDVFGKAMDYSRCDLFVPEASLKAYQAVAPWNKFNVKAIGTTALNPLENTSIQITLEGRTLHIQAEQETTYSLYSMQGEVLLQGMLHTGNSTIALDHLPLDTYLLRINAQSELIQLL